MKLILIHGRDQGGKDPVELRKTWIETLKKGLAKSGLQLPIPEESVVFPFYGDLLDELVDQMNENVEGIIKKGAEGSSTNARFFHDFFTEIAANAQITEAAIEAENTEILVEKGPLNWEWVHTILKAIDKNSKWSEASIKKFTYDVFLYLTTPGIRNKLHEEVLKVFTHEPCVVVGHSLGSIVSYNILSEIPSPAVKKLITVGSPLAVNAVKKYLKTPLKMPAVVEKGWFNAFDERDVVALKPLNSEYFNIQPPITNKNDVDNHTSNRHGIEGYLNDKTVAKIIYDYLVS